MVFTVMILGYNQPHSGLLNLILQISQSVIILWYYDNPVVLSTIYSCLLINEIIQWTLESHCRCNMFVI